MKRTVGDAIADMNAVHNALGWTEQPKGTTCPRCGATVPPSRAIFTRDLPGNVWVTIRDMPYLVLNVTPIGGGEWYVTFDDGTWDGIFSGGHVFMLTWDVAPIVPCTNHREDG